jgi:cysteinyl-tRNA synthetase
VTAAVLAAALGLSLRGEAAVVDEETIRLVAERDAARAARDFARADALRDELTAMGWTVEDTPSGTAVRR